MSDFVHEDGQGGLFDDKGNGVSYDLIDEKASLVLDEMMENMTTQFADLKVSKTALYNFVTEKCAINFKKAQ